MYFHGLEQQKGIPRLPHGLMGSETVLSVYGVHFMKDFKGKHRQFELNVAVISYTLQNKV